MSNEQLATLAKAGDIEAAHSLWEQNSGFLYRTFERYFPLCQQCRCEPDDLLQSGFPAVLEAAQTFNPDKGGFLGWLSFYARKAALDVLELRKKKPLLLSLDAPAAAEDDGYTLQDTLADEAAEMAFSAATDDLYNAHVRAVAGQCLDKLHPLCSAAIYGRYFEGKTQQQVGAEHGVSGEAIRQHHDKAIRKLRNDKFVRRLEEYHNAIHRRGYRDYSLSAFRERGSGVEAAAIRREEMLDFQHKQTMEYSEHAVAQNP